VQKFWSREWQELRKRGLVWLLLLACLAVTLVMADQARTLEQQRALIQVLQSDSQELFAGRIQDLVNRRKAQKPPESPPPATPPEAEPPQKSLPPRTAAPPAPPEAIQPLLHPARIMRSI
jgi:hypothetical protein